MVSILINIHEDGGKVIYPIFNIDDDVQTFKYFFLVPKFCFEYMESPLFYKLFVLDGTNNSIGNEKIFKANMQ